MLSKNLDSLTLEDLDNAVKQEEKQNKKNENSSKFSMDRMGFPAGENYQVLDIIGYASNTKDPIVFTEMIWHKKKCFDLRHWKNNMEKPLKGMTFTKTELSSIGQIGYIETIKDDNYEEVGRYKYKNQEAIIYKMIMTYNSVKFKDKILQKGVYIVDWGKGPKIDIRGWADDYSVCTKGITLSLEEFNKFVNLILD